METGGVGQIELGLELMAKRNLRTSSFRKTANLQLLGLDEEVSTMDEAAPDMEKFFW